MPDTDRSALPYLLPMAGFLALTALEGVLPQTAKGPSPFWYPLIYTVKVIVVSGLAWACRATWRDLSPRPSVPVLVLAVVMGLAVTALWVGLDGHYPELPFVGGKRAAFDPTGLARVPFWGFASVRMFGLVVLIPWIEELFWRSFLMRWVIDPDFVAVPVGRVTLVTALATSVLFGLAHPEWLPGLITGLVWSWLLWRTKSLSACLVSHMAANLALGVYVLSARDWKFW